MLKGLLVLSLLVFSASANAVCYSMSEAKAKLVVDAINMQVKLSPTKLATLDASVMFRNVKEAKVVKTDGGFSQVAIVTPYSTPELPYAIIHLNNAYLKIEGTNQGVHLGYLAGCKSIEKNYYPLARELN